MFKQQRNTKTIYGTSKLGIKVPGAGVFLCLFLLCLPQTSSSCNPVRFSLVGSPTGEIFYNNLLDRKMTATALDCARKCTGLQGCVGYKFYPVNGTCDMRSFLVEQGAAIGQGFTSYTRYIEVSNIAIGKTASLSSTVYPHYSPPNALTGGCAWSAYGTNPWWKVDLGQPYNIYTIQVTTSDSCCATDPIATLEVALGNGCPPSTACPDTCTKTWGLLAPSSLQEFSCVSLSGSYQYVELRVPGVSKQLRVCDVKVIGN
ncbi:uncharacterized protein [Haliotis cracherodii]|uniref:uncharacterized protein n=1 Tax=Haliotis cracherodii TaxID=6455 RepID=UPI0039E7A259